MKKEELLKAFKNQYQNIGGVCQDVNDVAVEFIDSLPIPFENIDHICDMDEWDYDDKTCYIDVMFVTNNGSSNGMIYFKYERKPQRVVLRQVFKNALESWYKWSGNPTYNYSYLKDDKVYLYYEQYGEKKLYEELQNCRETILATMLDCSKDLWKNKNVKRWNEYQQYIAPILIALDFIEEGVQVYE
jgi:hypothetical protein